MSLVAQIKELYLQAFGTGLSAQYIDESYLQTYLSDTLTRGQAVLCFYNKKLIACLLSLPLFCDEYCPDEILHNFQSSRCSYISEIMVATDYQGYGIGRELIQFFFKSVNRFVYSDVFIRVWDKNEVALRLYQKMGFQTYCAINQKKIAADGVTPIQMTKLYLHKHL